MKIKFYLLASVVLFFCMNTAAQQAVYDSALAKRLGADERGMRSYIFVILKTGTAENISKAVSDSLFAGHMKNIGRLADEGKLVLAGPFGKNDKTYRGLYIFTVSTIDEAKELVATDPAVAGKLLEAEYFKWYGSAAVMAIPELHGKIQKKSL
ncbi:MAG: YciI family protein [Ferruginibacter sp.]